MFHNLSL